MAILQKSANHAFWVGGLLIGLRAVFMVITGDSPDFSVFYHATRDLITGSNPYTDSTLFTVFAYPPVTAWTLMPLAVLPYAVAKGAWTVVTLGALIVSAFIAVRLVYPDGTRVWTGAVFFLLILSFPARFTIGMGQINGFALVLLLSSVWCAVNKKQTLAGILFGLSATAKPQLMLLLPLFFLTGYAKAGWDGVKTLVVAAGVSFFAYWGTTLFYLNSIVGALAVYQGAETYYNQGIRAILSRTVAGDTTVFYWISSAILYSLVLWMIVKKHLPIIHAFAVLLPVMLLIEPLSWQHHYIFLLPSYVLAYRLLAGSARGKVLFILSIALVSYNIARPVLLSGLGFQIILSHVGVGTLLLVGMLVLRMWFRYDKGIDRTILG